MYITTSILYSILSIRLVYNLFRCWEYEEKILRSIRDRFSALLLQSFPPVKVSPSETVLKCYLWTYTFDSLKDHERPIVAEAVRKSVQKGGTF